MQDSNQAKTRPTKTRKTSQTNLKTSIGNRPTRIIIQTLLWEIKPKTYSIAKKKRGAEGFMSA